MLSEYALEARNEKASGGVFDNTASNVTYTATNREFIFIDFRAPASGGNVTVINNNFNMPNDYDWFSGAYFTSKLIPKQTTEWYLLSRNVSSGSPTVRSGWSRAPARAR